MPVLRRSHRGGGRPCVHCGHDYGRHAARAGRCALEQCDCRGYLAGGADASGSVRVVTPAQLRDGFVRQRGIGDPGDRADYAVIRRLDDGNYLVKDPGPPASGLMNTDPENFTAQERAEARELRDHQPPAPRGHRNAFTGEWTDRPSRAEAERDEALSPRQ